ncbi:MAG: amidohydrolase family protein, partial [Lentisphaerae bacterium]|nr:amidohydrolase family protein [Lentisphaerota bacterium]
MIWDMHHHWVNETGYIDRLLRTMDRLGIEKTGLIAMGEVARDLFVEHAPAGQAVGHAGLAEWLKTHGDRFWGYGYLRPGEARPDDVDRLVDMGMTALKFHVPLKPYGEPEYFPVYARAAEHTLPCLFHTGIFYPP